MERFLDLRAGTWTSLKHRKNWENALTGHAGSLMNMPVDQIEPADVVAVLSPIWAAKEETARRVRQRIERVLSASIVLGERPEPNPAAWRDRLEFVLDKQPRNVTHHASIPFEDMPGVFARLWTKRDDGQGARGLVLAILTAMRSGEVRGLCWAEIDGDTIVIPAARMKMKRAHRVALSPRVVDYLGTVPRMAGCDLVLPSGRLGQISDATMMKALRVAGYGDFTVHGFRSTFSMWASAMGYRREWVEDALAHTVGTEIERAYRRGDYLDQRREIMAAWADFLFSAK
jgi:integrase